jgi:two-component system, NarL family, nitrate/nitrite response regulator NarL
MPSSKHTIRVAVADDHAMFRDGLRLLLNASRDLTVVGEASNGDDCLKLLAKLKPDVLLLDLRMPGMDSLEVLGQIKLHSISTHVIALSDTKNNREVASAMRRGARGIVQKQSAGDVLIKIIRRVYSGEISLDESLGVTAMDDFARAAEATPRRKNVLLSDRETEIVHLVAQGFRNREIADKLFIAQQTVKNHVHDIFDKLGVSDRLELALYAVHHHWFDENAATPTEAATKTNRKD